VNPEEGFATHGKEVAMYNIDTSKNVSPDLWDYLTSWSDIANALRAKAVRL
jgi:hypothetical protein